MTDIVSVAQTDTVTGVTTVVAIVDVGYSVAAPSSVPVSGGNMSGTLTLNGSPPLVVPSGAASGDVLTSDSSGHASWQAATVPAATSSVPGGIELNTDLGGTATAPQVVATHLAGPLPVAQGGTGSATLNFADLTSTQSIGGTKTFTGEVIVPAPSAAGDAVTKAYADSISLGLNVKPAAVAATVGTESFTISSGDVTAITGTTTLDGVTPQVNDFILVKDAPAADGTGSVLSSEPGNGLYQVASITSDLNLSRATAMSGSNGPAGAFVFVEGGTANKGAGYVVTTPAGAGAFTYGSGAIQWTQFSGAGSISAGTGLTQAGSVLSLAIPVAIASGGTGVTTSGVYNVRGYGAKGNALQVTDGAMTASSATLTCCHVAPVHVVAGQRRADGGRAGRRGRGRGPGDDDLRVHEHAASSPSPRPPARPCPRRP